MSNIQFVPTLTHSVNSSGRMGLFVDPHGCSCEGCHDYLASATGIAEPPGFSNLSPPSSLNLERQTGVLQNNTEGSPVFSPLSRTSSLPLAEVGIPLPRRTNGGGISPPVGLGATPTGLGNWRALISEGFRESRWDDQEEETDHSGLCHCGPCTGVHEKTGMPLQIRDEIREHLNNYLMMLEKHQKVIFAKMDLYAFLLEDASIRLRVEGFSKRIKELKTTLQLLE